MKEKFLPYKCECGGKMKEVKHPIEVFGIDYGLKKAEKCIKCGAVYFDDEVMGEIEKDIKKRGLFGLERKIVVSKSKDSLVIKIPPEIRKMLRIKHKSILSLVPIDKKTFEVHVIS